jgi:hypothetical protein
LEKVNDFLDDLINVPILKDPGEDWIDEKLKEDPDEDWVDETIIAKLRELRDPVKRNEFARTFRSKRSDSVPCGVELLFTRLSIERFGKVYQKYSQGQKK